MNFWAFVIGLDKAIDGLLNLEAGIDTVDADLTISAAVGILASYDHPSRAKAEKWLNRIEGAACFWLGQHCHCADAALGELANVKPDIVALVKPILQGRINAAAAAGLRTTI